jgi:ferritin-like metal-binding protein YciE
MTRTPTRKALLTRRGINRALLVEKLCQRWLFARSAAHLYELALARMSGESSNEAESLQARFKRFVDEEKLHAQMLEALLAELGRSPRAAPATPAINITASEAATLLELARDRQFGIGELLSVAEAAELLDVAGWERLIQLSRDADLDAEWLRSFHSAFREAEEHLHIMRTHSERLERKSLETATPSRP